MDHAIDKGFKDSLNQSTFCIMEKARCLINLIGDIQPVNKPAIHKYNGLKPSNPYTPGLHGKYDYQRYICSAWTSI